MKERKKSEESFFEFGGKEKESESFFEFSETEKTEERGFFEFSVDEEEEDEDDIKFSITGAMGKNSAEFYIRLCRRRLESGKI